MSLLFKQRNSAGANQRKLGMVAKIIAFFVGNIRHWLVALGDIWRDPIPSILTVAVLGVSLTLPSIMYVVAKNAQSVEQHWQSAAEISLFLHTDLSDKQIQTFVKQVQLHAKVEKVTFVSNEQALDEFEQLSGFGDALSLLEANPLPNVLIVIPLAEYALASPAADLLTELEQMREVEFGKLDIEWLRRLNAVLSLIKDTMGSLGLLLCVSVVLIVGNTIRLSIINRKEEIEVLKLVGATDGFIQRPFLFTGLWYGFFGGLIAWLSIEIMLYYLSGSIVRIADLYQSDFRLSGLSVAEMVNLLLISMGLGLSGSYLVVRKQILLIEPDSSI
ncbi:permease-like cell division protein FtsX [Catenovulum sp. SX2]|uniref:permease-like cell division protein FtsX n=1 Tax=Catenovulum sp. SX2 TaxID=3398614 RepID=UPI003F865B06